MGRTPGDPRAVLARKRAYNARWKKANPEKHRKSARESAQRCRAKPQPLSEVGLCKPKTGSAYKIVFQRVGVFFYARFSLVEPAVMLDEPAILLDEPAILPDEPGVSAFQHVPHRQHPRRDRSRCKTSHFAHLQAQFRTNLLNAAACTTLFRPDPR
ncbi:hypothetical protein HMN09_00152300 [Mycena chlorophos]|uniref:Uncharacterized protein n=1 Tax=Mycena chlorophos TaxID=658473 RepID=A0A8H6WMY8_MYCCL|nr:hypothetical protein HMN09_00152300 [Mycena chlorophos]